MKFMLKNTQLAIYVAFFMLSAPALAYEENDWWKRLSISGGVTAVIQGTSGNNDPAGMPASGAVGSSDGSNFSYTADINMDIELESNQFLHIALESGDGNGVANELPDGSLTPNYDPYITINRDNKQSLVISQAFYEGVFASGHFIVDIGKMDFHSFYDDNNLANDETSQFMNGLFVRHTGSIMAELEGYYSFGAGVQIIPIEGAEFVLVVANPNNEKLGLGSFLAAQLTVTPNLIDGYEGNYRLYYVRDDSKHGGIAFTSTTSGKRLANDSYGLSFDQMFAGKFGLFLRGTMQNDNVDDNLYKSAVSGGLHIAGANWNRGDDHAGIAAGAMMANDKSSAYKAAATIYKDNPIAYEIYYHWQINPHISITPDVQVLNFVPRTQKRHVSIYGIRAQLDF